MLVKQRVTLHTQHAVQRCLLFVMLAISTDTVSCNDLVVVRLHMQLSMICSTR